MICSSREGTSCTAVHQQYVTVFEASVATAVGLFTCSLSTVHKGKNQLIHTVNNHSRHRDLHDLRAETHTYLAVIRGTYGHTPAAESSCRKGREEVRDP